MNNSNKKLKPGPFRVSVEISSSEGLMVEQYKRVGNDTTNKFNPSSVEFEVKCENVLKSAPIRRHNCENYQTCLDLSASLDWDSFSCEGCNSCINEKLLWRAKGAQKAEPELAKLVSLPNLAKLRRRV